MDRLERQMAFIKEIDKSKQIFRQTYICDGSRKENDAEHAWHLALMCLLTGEYANEPIDMLKTVTMVLIHDIIEIDAGDTYAYDAKANEDKGAREAKAAERLFGLLPEDQGEKFRKLWEEFDAADTPEARFANTLDKVQPVLLNDASGGKSWEEHDVCMSQILKRNEKTAEGSGVLWDYAEGLVEKNSSLGHIKDDRKDKENG